MNSQDGLKEKVLLGLGWKFLERGGSKGIQFVVSLVLARLLLPADFGLIAIISIFITIGNVFVQSGFNTALIQKQQVDEKDLSTVFYITLSVAVLIYLALFLTAPGIAAFFEVPMLNPVLRVLALILLLFPITSIQNAIVARRMEFKKLFFSSVVGIVGSGILGVGMAYQGFGVWSLVAQQLSNEFLIMAVLWFTVKWRPKVLFSWERFRTLFSFGWKLLFSSLLNVTYDNLYGFVIGKLFKPEMLGYYSRGQHFPNFIVSNIDGSIQSVLFPAFASQQSNRERLKQLVRRSIVTSSFVMFPMMVGLAACAEPLVKVLLTEKWLPAVPFLQFMCFSYILWPIHTANLQAINALGRSDIFLKLEIIKKVIGIVVLVFTIPHGIYVMVAVQPLNGLISSFINAYPNKRLLDYSVKQQ